MKTNLLRGWRSIFAVSCTVALLGCLDQPGESNAQTARVVNTTNSPVVEPPAIADEAPPLKAVIPPADLSPGLPEVIQLAQSAVGDEVLLAYIEKSERSFNPTVDEIVYLKDIGLSEAVIAALVRATDESNAVPQSPPIPAQNNNVFQAPAPAPEANRPSLVDAAAPSYSVAAEPSYTEVAPAPSQQVNISYFESALSPYGSWVEVADYGRCWQPTVVVVNRSWRPYADRGRWVYTSSGWYWQSDYSWGWAPFHYGRWHRDHHIGWVWVPGSTWGPAWVSWRYTDSYCGWAPLPPAARYESYGFYYQSSRVGIGFDFGLHHDYYTFIPTSRFCDRNPYRHYVSGSHSRTIYNNSTVINNYVRGNNNTIINEGIGRDRISRATHAPIRTLGLRDLPATTAPVGRTERVEGDRLAVFRPNVTAHGAATRALTGSSRATAATIAENNSPPANPGAPQRSSATMNRSGIGHSNPRETAVTTPATQAQATPTRTATSPGHTTFPRTWSQTSGTARNSASTADQRQLLTDNSNSGGTAPSSGVAQPTHGASGLRRLPSAQPSTPGQRQVPASISETLRPRETATVSQPAPRVQPSPISVPQAQPARREYNQSPARNHTPTLGSSRSLPSAQQPNYNIPNNGNQSSRFERSAPRSIQSFPRATAPTVSAPPQQPQQRIQTAPQRSEPATRQPVDRSNRGHRTKD